MFEGLSAMGLVGDDWGSRGLVTADDPGLVDGCERNEDDKSSAVVAAGWEPVESADFG